MTVLADWKKQLGADWDKTYAASNTIYVARQNNVLFSVLAQFFGPDAINGRLLLIETVSFTTTPEDMLESLTRIIADRSVGALFFGNYHLMDYELMGGDARAAIIAETGKRGMTPFLPPVVPFGSKQWPTLVTPGPGPASIADSSICASMTCVGARGEKHAAFAARVREVGDGERHRAQPVAFGVGRGSRHCRRARRCRGGATGIRPPMAPAGSTASPRSPARSSTHRISAPPTCRAGRRSTSHAHARPRAGRHARLCRHGSRAA